MWQIQNIANQSSMISLALSRYCEIFSICFNFLAQELVSEKIRHISFQLYPSCWLLTLFFIANSLKFSLNFSACLSKYLLEFSASWLRWNEQLVLCFSTQRESLGSMILKASVRSWMDDLGMYCISFFWIYHLLGSCSRKIFSFLTSRLYLFDTNQRSSASSFSIFSLKPIYDSLLYLKKVLKLTQSRSISFLMLLPHQIIMLFSFMKISFKWLMPSHFAEDQNQRPDSQSSANLLPSQQSWFTSSTRCACKRLLALVIYLQSSQVFLVNFLRPEQQLTFWLVREIFTKPFQVYMEEMDSKVNLFSACITQNVTSFFSCQNLLLSLMERKPSTYLELKIEGILTRSFRKNVKILILFQMCLTVRLEAFLSGMGGTICVGKNFLSMFLSQMKSLYLLPTHHPSDCVLTWNSRKLVAPKPISPPVNFLSGLHNPRFTC